MNVKELKGYEDYFNVLDKNDYYYEKEHARLMRIHDKTKKKRIKKKIVKRLFKLAYLYA